MTTYTMTFPLNSAGTYTTGDSYQCAQCGAWVIGYHSCWTAPYNTWPNNTPSYPTTYIYQPTDLTPVLEKLDELLKEIRKQNKKKNT